MANIFSRNNSDRWKYVVLWCLLILLSFLYSFPEILEKRPQIIHAWRATDCLSLTKTFYDNDLDFFHPGIYQYLFNDFSTSETVGECTWLYYFIAILWKIFGVHEWMYRLVVILIFFTGLHFVMRSLRLLKLDTFWSIFIPVFFFTSPVLAYYGNNFLTDVPALGLSFIGVFYWLSYLIENKRSALWWGVLFFSLAGLIKITSLMMFCVFGGLFFFELIGTPLLKGRKIFIHRWHFFSGFAAVIFTNIAWLLWASYYNTLHNGWFTPNSIWPLWDLSPEIVAHINKEFSEYLLFTAYHKSALIFFGFCTLLLLLTWKFQEWLHRLTWILTIIGVTGYLLLFYKAFDVHDYYLVVTLVLPLTVLTMIVILTGKHWPMVAKSSLLKTSISLLAVFNIYYCSVYMDLRYDPPLEKITMIDNVSTKLELHQYFHWDWERRMKAIETIEPYLESVGITTDKKIISIPDNSYNISLYLANRKGWTGHELYSADAMMTRIKNGAEYLLVNDTAYVQEEPWLREFMKTRVGQYENVQIFDLRGF